MTDKIELKKRLGSSSSKWLLLNDIHLRDHPPRNCTDAYLEDIFDILKFTAKLERALDLTGVIWAGDIFDHKLPSKTSHRLVLRTIEIVKSYRNLWILPGNHDITNDRLESIDEQQPLGVLYEAGAHRLEGWMNSEIYGIPWQQRWLEDGVLEEVLAPWRSKDTFLDPKKTLVVTHASIVPPAQISEVMYDVLHPSDIAAAMNHTGNVHYGHIHDDHGIYEVDGVTFSNPGAISRGSLTEKNQSRSVKGSLWTPEHGFLELDLPHLPAEKIYLLEPAAAKKEKKISDERFLEEVGSTRLEISSVAGVVEHIRSLVDVEEPVKNVAIEMLELQDD